MSWTFDAPSGTYKNHALSKDIRRQAIADAQFMRFMRAEPGFGRGKGESVTITRVLSLPLATRVSETDRLPSGRPAIQTKQVNTAEWGFKIPVTDYEKRLSHFNIMDPFQSALRDQMTLTMDAMSATAMKLTPIKYTPMATGFNLETDGTPSGTSDRNMGVQDLRRIHDYLHGDLKAPAFKNGKYVGILSTKGARGIKNDSEYKDWVAPTSSEPLISGKLKSIEGFDLYETNHFDAMDNTAGASTVLGEAIFFGMDAGGLVEVMSPEIRMGIPEDLGRFAEVGWVGIIDAFLVWETAALARAVHVTSE